MKLYASRGGQVVSEKRRAMKAIKALMPQPSGRQFKKLRKALKRKP